MVKAKKARARRARKKQPVPFEPLVNPHAAMHGDYRVEALPVTSGELDSAKHGQMRVTRNRGGTTVERWLASGSLSPAQAQAIALYIRAWHLWMGQPRVTANWSLVASIRGASSDSFIPSQVAAKELIDMLDGHVFKSMPHRYVDVWKNVVIHDEAAGVVGSRLGYRNKGAEASAKAIVLFIADMIAQVMRLG